MSKIEYVNNKIKEIGFKNTFPVRKEIKEMANILQDDEELVYAISGITEGDTWLISCTDRRVIFLNNGFVYGLKQKEIPLNRINSIEQSKGFVYGKIAIWDGASKIEIGNILKPTIPIMVETINKAIDDAKKNTQPQQSNSIDVSEQLEKLASLRDRQIVTQDEFEKQKAKILNS